MQADDRRPDAAPNAVLVLGYHAISPTWPAALAVTQEALRGQLEWIVAQGYRGVTFHEAVTSSPEGRVVAVTFDDAYASVLELAQPVLASLGLPGTVFAVTDFAADGRPLEWPGIDHWRSGPHEHELRALSWNALRVLAESGWEIGSHTLTHPRLTQLDDGALERELLHSREACERALGQPCRSLAYPYGDWDPRVVAAAAAAGYSAAAIEGLAQATPLTWPRVGVYRANSPWAFRLKASSTLRRVRCRVGRAERRRSRLVAAAVAHLQG